MAREGGREGRREGWEGGREGEKKENLFGPDGKILICDFVTFFFFFFFFFLILQGRCEGWEKRGKGERKERRKEGGGVGEKREGEVGGLIFSFYI